MTAGGSVFKGQQIMTGGGELRIDGHHRGSITHLSQLTPSQQPLTGEDRLIHNFPLHLHGSQNNFFLTEPVKTPLTPQDAHNLLAYR